MTLRIQLHSIAGRGESHKRTGDPMKSIELFAGIGGISLAAEWAGIETVAFCEIDNYAGKVLKKNWPNVPLFKDIKKLNRQVLEENGVIEKDGSVELISGGFPCQPYSIAGNKRGKEDDRDLWPEMFRIIQELKPRWIVGENVAHFANMELERTLSDLESEGYRTQPFIIPACSVNAKHRRDRTFVVAHADNSGNRAQQHHIDKNGETVIEGRKEQSQFKFSGHSEVISNPAVERLQRSGEFIESFNTKKDREREAIKPFHECKPSIWPTEPNVGRVADGIPRRMDRLRCLGNAVVPQQIYPIFKAIMQIEKGEIR